MNGDYDPTGAITDTNGITDEVIWVLEKGTPETTPKTEDDDHE